MLIEINKIYKTYIHLFLSCHEKQQFPFAKIKTKTEIKMNQNYRNFFFLNVFGGFYLPPCYTCGVRGYK